MAHFLVLPILKHWPLVICCYIFGVYVTTESHGNLRVKDFHFMLVNLHVCDCPVEFEVFPRK